ncbi:hypothetical protein KJ611_03010 [Patescibacteria group bacterium]|nr:hypothetical protein [Patescibacteria group bacterium]
MSFITRFHHQYTRNFIDLLKHHKIYSWSTVISLVLVILTFALPAWRVLPLVQEQDFLPLHYNIYFGIDRFGPWYYIFVPAALGGTLLIINLIFQTAFFRRESVLSYFFAVATVFSEIMLFVAMIFIVLLNI